MKILHVIPDLLKGGAQRIVLDICQELSKNHEIYLVCFTSENEYSFLGENVKIKIISTSVAPSILGKSVVVVKDLQDYINRIQPDVVHSHLFLSEIVLSYIDLPKHTKRFFHFHDNMPQMENLKLKSIFNKLKLTNFYEKRKVIKSYKKQKANAICISNDSNKYAISVLPKKLKKILLFNAIDLSRFVPSENNLIHDGVFEISIVGRLVDIKNQQLAIETIYELNEKGHQVHLNIIGVGPNEHLLKKMVEEMKIQHAVTFHGIIDFPEKILSNSNAYMHTATYEPFGLVLIEAMACGLPVISTNGKGNKDLIIEGENGFLIDNFDAKLIALAIEKIILNEDLRNQMSIKARYFSEKFDIKEYCKKLILIYQNAK